MKFNSSVNYLFELFACCSKVDFKSEGVFFAVNIAEILRNTGIENQSSVCRIDKGGPFFAVKYLSHSHLDGSMYSELLIFISHFNFIEIAEDFALSLFAGMVY